MAILGRKMVDFESFQKHVPTCLEGVWEYLSVKIVIIIGIYLGTFFVFREKRKTFPRYNSLPPYQGDKT